MGGGSMLDEICPVQFVEGVNECAEATDDYINTMEYSGVAIEYTPTLSYSLKRVDIFLTHQQPSNENKYKVALCTDYGNKPSDIVLSKGEWAWRDVLGDWQRVELEPVVVTCNKKYWLTIDLDKGNIGLPIAQGEEAKEVSLRFRGEYKWVIHGKFKKDKVMLRFYGRILPIVG